MSMQTSDSTAKFERVETLGVNDSSLSSTKDKPAVREIPEELESNNNKKLKIGVDGEVKIEDFQSSQADTQQEKEQVGEPNTLTKAPYVPTLQLKNIQARIKEDLNNEAANFKVDRKEPKPKEKRKINYQTFQEEKSQSSFTDSLPPDNGEVVVNISAIEIDKNDISIYNSPRNDAASKNRPVQEQVSNRRTKLLIILILIVSLIILIGCGYILYTIQSSPS